MQTFKPEMKLRLSSMSIFPQPHTQAYTLHTIKMHRLFLIQLCAANKKETLSLHILPLFTWMRMIVAYDTIFRPIDTFAEESRVYRNV